MEEEPNMSVETKQTIRDIHQKLDHLKEYL